MLSVRYPSEKLPAAPRDEWIASRPDIRREARRAGPRHRPTSRTAALRVFWLVRTDPWRRRARREMEFESQSSNVHLGASPGASRRSARSSAVSPAPGEPGRCRSGRRPAAGRSLGYTSQLIRDCAPYAARRSIAWCILHDLDSAAAETFSLSRCQLSAGAGSGRPHTVIARLDDRATGALLSRRSHSGFMRVGQAVSARFAAPGLTRGDVGR